ncbi:MAG: polymer-forming cytoskeletal protein [Gemmobacter sp.]
MERSASAPDNSSDRSSSGFPDNRSGSAGQVSTQPVVPDIVINGRVIGRVRGLKVRLTSTARVEGDIIHKTIAIESGAHFEGSVQRQDDPLAAGKPGLAAG